MDKRRGGCLLAMSLLPLALVAGAQDTRTLNAFAIEGMGVVSTADSEIRATVSPDGERIAWGSTNRKGGPGGWDIWQATRRDGRWTDAEPVAIDTDANEFDPFFSADGRWLYFFSNRAGGQGGDDLFRAPVRADGSVGAAQNLGPGVNGSGDEWAPTVSVDGQHLLFASDSFGGTGRHDLLVAHWNGSAFVDPKPVPGIDSADDDFDAAWLGDGRAIVFARSPDVDNDPVRLFVAQCDGTRYVDVRPLDVAFNTADGNTMGPVVDASKPTELLVSGIAKSLHAGRMDIYRMRTPMVTGRDGCL